MDASVTNTRKGMIETLNLTAETKRIEEKKRKAGGTLKTHTVSHSKAKITDLKPKTTNVWNSGQLKPIKNHVESLRDCQAVLFSAEHLPHKLSDSIHLRNWVKKIFDISRATVSIKPDEFILQKAFTN